MKSKTAWIAVLLGPWLMAAAVPVAALIKWDNSSSTGTCDAPTVVDGSIVSCSPATPVGGTSLTETAISNTGSSGSLAAAYLGTYGGGVGVTSQGETLSVPQHAMDNNGNSEFMLFTFGAPVSVGAVEIGYISTDSDFTVLAYTGCSGCTPNPIGDSYGGIVGNAAGTGWTLVGHYANTSVSPVTRAVNAYSAGLPTAASLSSSYWLIGAYNNSFGATVSDSNSDTSHLRTGNDYIKLLAVYGDTKPNTPPTSVPEPSSLLLIGIALLAMTELRRRRVI